MRDDHYSFTTDVRSSEYEYLPLGYHACVITIQIITQSYMFSLKIESITHIWLLRHAR